MSGSSGMESQGEESLSDSTVFRVGTLGERAASKPHLRRIITHRRVERVRV